MGWQEEMFSWLKAQGPWGYVAIAIIIIIVAMWVVVNGYAAFLSSMDTISAHLSPPKNASHIETKSNTTHNNLSNDELKTQTKELSSQIFNFIGERKKTDPATNNYPVTQINFNTSQEQKEWNDYNKQIKDYNDETVTIYHMKYLPSVIKIKQELKKHNLTDAQLDSFDSLQVNSIGIEITAEKLLELANKLP